jgi:hypothetical protein
MHQGEKKLEEDAVPRMTGLDWVGLDWVGLDWTRLDWVGSANRSYLVTSVVLPMNLAQSFAVVLDFVRKLEPSSRTAAWSTGGWSQWLDLDLDLESP